jgi:5,10-methylenetetrahydromethanopterin reductase
MNPVSMAKPGLMLSSELPPRELLELARLAEDLDYGQLWYTDQRFWRDCYIGLSQIASVTSRIRLGPGVNDPFTRHPALIAMAIATLDELSDGRAQLGLGVGGSGIAQMKLPKHRPVRALREGIEIIRLMMSGERVEYEGEVFTLVDGSLGFKPVRDQIPIYVATHGQQVLKLSAKLADGVLLGNMGRREAVEWAAATVRSAEQSAGREKGQVKIDLRLETLISDDGDQALAVMRARLAHRLVASYPNWDFMGGQRDLMHSGIAEAARRRDLKEVQSLLSDEDVRSSVLVGSPDAVADQLSQILTPDVGNVTIRPYSVPGMSQGVTVRLFAERVWPLLSVGVT